MLVMVTFVVFDCSGHTDVPQLDLALHVRGEEVVFVLQEADRGDGGALLKAEGLPGV